VAAVAAAAGDQVTENIGWAGIGAGVATYTAGYVFFGGHRCQEGRRLYRHLDHSRYARTMRVHGQETAKEMQAIAAAFNRQRKATHAQP